MSAVATSTTPNRSTQSSHVRFALAFCGLFTLPEAAALASRRSLRVIVVPRSGATAPAPRAAGMSPPLTGVTPVASAAPASGAAAVATAVASAAPASGAPTAGSTGRGCSSDGLGAPSDGGPGSVSYTHLRAHETGRNL